MVFKVAIIGGGLGGLALAHALTRSASEGRAEGLEVVVYEQREIEDEMQRYPLHLDPNGRQALRGILSEDNYAKMVEQSAQGTAHGGISIFSPGFKRLFHTKQYEGQQPQFLHRWLLRDILSEGVRIESGKRVARVENPTGGGKAKLFFEGGETDFADLVVGADGVGSSIRNQLYPSHAQFERLPYLNIQMKLSTSPSQLPKSLDPHGINLITGTQDYSLLLVPFHPITTPAKDYSLLIVPSPSGMTPPTDHTKVATPEPSSEQLSEEPGFLFAILTVHTFEAWETTTQWGWKNKLVELLEADEADESLLRAFKHDIIPGTIGAPWEVVRCDPDRPVRFDGGNVVLIGDAAHAMPPQAGAGASTALLDAHRLAEVILSSGELGGTAGPILSLLPAFHETMMKRANQHVKDATRRLYLSNRSGWGVTTQRATLRAMGWVWPIVSWFGPKERGSEK